MTCDLYRRDDALECDTSLVPEGLKELLAKENECYVLITCKKPSKEGKMQVEMTYEGDASLAAYLIESAQNYL